MASETPKRATRPAADATSSPSRSEGRSAEDTAASKIQALARGAHVRAAEKDKRLWNAWNELDWKEESELMESHTHYEQMKKKLEEKKKAAEAAAAASSAASAAAAAGSRELSGAAAIAASPESFSIPVPKRELTGVPAPGTGTPPPAPVAGGALAGAAPVSPPHAKPAEVKEEKPKPAAEDDGLTLSDPIQLDFVTAMMDHFKSNKVLDIGNVTELLKRVKPMLAKLPNVVMVPVNTRITVVGDLHGQLDDLLAIFKLNGLPSPRNSYVFNGDFVDRGQYSCECILILIGFKLLYPNYLHLNRGNHEARDINSRDGFEKECIQKYNSHIFDLFSDVFACLPLACVLEGDKKVFVVHGGLFWDDLNIPQIQEIKRFHEIPPTGSHMEQMLWSDPDPEPGRQESPRGASLLFGPDITDKFLKDNGLCMVIRSHECMQQGFEKMHNDTLITIFSASNYCKSVGNDGAFVIFEKDMVPKIVTFYAKPKERLSRYRMRHALLENDIISKLLQRIADNRLGLVNYYRTVETKEGGIGTVTRQQWADGLKKVLKLNIPFLEFQDYLGLPKLGVDGKKKGSIDHMAFLLRFKPVNTLLARSVWREEPDGKNREVLKSLESINEVLFRNRYELESLFRHFDTNGDDRISVGEFKEGILSLQGMLDCKFSEVEVDQLVKHIDMNGDGFVSYSEFFSSFQLVDPKLAERQATGAKIRSGVPPGGGPTPPASPSSSSAPASAASSATPSPTHSPALSPAAHSPTTAEKKETKSDSEDAEEEEDDDKPRKAGAAPAKNVRGKRKSAKK